jgi:hypothetical protein
VGKSTRHLVLFNVQGGMAMSILYRTERNKTLWRIRTARAVIMGGMFTIEHPSQEKSSQDIDNYQSRLTFKGLSPREQLHHWRNRI